MVMKIEKQRAMTRHASDLVNYLKIIGKSGARVSIVTHTDADGITSAAITSLTLKHLNIEHTIDYLNQIPVDYHPPDNRISIYTDLGSNTPSIVTDENTVILDHHVPCTDEYSVRHLNPHFHGFDGGYECSGSVVAWLVARAAGVDISFVDYLGIVGAIGDLQAHERFGLVGLNRLPVNKGLQDHSIQVVVTICAYGRHQRRIDKLLEYMDTPMIEGITGDPKGVERFLRKLEIDPALKWCELSSSEKQKILTALEERTPDGAIITCEAYEYKQAEMCTAFRDAQEFSTLLNACARNDAPEVGLNLCLNPKDTKVREATDMLLSRHKRRLVEALNVLKATIPYEIGHVLVFEPFKRIPERIIGIVIGMMLSECPGKVLVGTSRTIDGKIKMSLRANKFLTDKGVDLSEVVKHVTASVGGVGGGHAGAAGMVIEPMLKAKAVHLIDKIIDKQLHSK